MTKRLSTLNGHGFGRGRRGPYVAMRQTADGFDYFDRMTTEGAVWVTDPATAATFPTLQAVRDSDAGKRGAVPVQRSEAVS